MRIYLSNLNQPHDRQAFNRFTTPPEEIDEIHESDLPMQRDAQMVKITKLTFKSN